MRRVTPADLGALTALQRAAYARNRPLLGVEPLPLLTDYAALLADPGFEVWLDEAAGRPDGALIVAPREDNLWIESVAVRPEAQRTGRGDRLLAFAETRARDLGLGALRLLTGAPLRHLIDWYGRRGFAVEREEALPDRVVVHMAKALGPVAGRGGSGYGGPTDGERGAP